MAVASCLILLQVQAITFTIANAMFLRNQNYRLKQCSPPPRHSYRRRRRWHNRRRRRLWITPDQMPEETTRWATIAWSASGKKTSDCLNRPLAFFLAHFISRCQGNKQLVNHSVPGVVVVGKRLESEYPFGVNSYEFEQSNIDQSRNKYEYGKFLLV